MANKQACTFTSVTNRLLNCVPDSLSQTLPLDNCAENAAHVIIADDKGVEIFIAHSHAPWQRVTNEQVSGMIRGYFT